MKNTTEAPRWYKRLPEIWRAIMAKGPCIYCGKTTRSVRFDGEFRHISCADEYFATRWEKQKREAEDRRQINLYKQAIRELEREKAKP